MNLPLKRAGVLLMVLVLCLTVLGVGYAGWTDKLDIRGYATMGQSAFEIGWSEGSTDDSRTYNWDGTYNINADPCSCDPNQTVEVEIPINQYPYTVTEYYPVRDVNVFEAWDTTFNYFNSHYTVPPFWEEFKDVGYTNVRLVDTVATNGGYVLRETAIVTVVNAYPGYMCEVRLKLMNAGPGNCKVSKITMEDVGTSDCFVSGDEFTCAYNGSFWEWSPDPYDALNAIQVGLYDHSAPTVLIPWVSQEVFVLDMMVQNVPNNPLPATNTYSFKITVEAEAVY
jgi:hypothetical protein